jgi:hypothetical protein
MTTKTVAGILFVALVAIGCASGGSSSDPASASRARSATDVITADELAKIEITDAYSAIQRLRPNFLQTRGVASMNTAGANSGPVVYLDNNKIGAVATLRQISTSEIKEIRYLGASDATQRFGTGHTSGAILVTRK